jgi:hypothetical protein
MDNTIEQQIEDNNKDFSLISSNKVKKKNNKK